MANRWRPRVRDFNRFTDTHKIPRVSRDPCPRCGARGGVDCGHSRAPLRTIIDYRGNDA
jgi:hypothetical protein